MRDESNIMTLSKVKRLLFKNNAVNDDHELGVVVLSTAMLQDLDI